VLFWPRMIILIGVRLVLKLANKQGLTADGHPLPLPFSTITEHYSLRLNQIWRGTPVRAGNFDVISSATADFLLLEMCHNVLSQHTA
jgi:hypothetical protein